MNKGWKRSLVVCALIMMGMLCGCSTGTGEEGKVRDLEFTVIGEDQQPEALKEVIEEKKTKPFQISYTQGDDLYISVGYGEQQTGGYSITVNELYETENEVVLNTTLAGPGVDETVTESLSYPYLVIKTEKTDKNIIFE